MPAPGPDDTVMFEPTTERISREVYVHLPAMYQVKKSLFGDGEAPQA